MHAQVQLNDILIDFVNQQVFKDGQWCAVDGQCLKVLSCLVLHYPQTVTRDHILDQAWDGLIVSDNSLSQAITSLRKILDDDPKQSTFIRTVPRKGYQLVAEVCYPLSQDKAKSGEVVKTLFKLNPWTSGISILAVVFIGLFLYQRDNLKEAQIASQTKGLDFSGIQVGLETRNQDFEAVGHITSKLGIESYLSFSPNGNWLAYSETASTGDNFDLVIANVVNNSHFVLLSSAGDEIAGDWSPDGKALAYVYQDDDNCEIRVINVEVSNNLNVIETNTEIDSLNSQVLLECEHSTTFPIIQWASNHKLYIAVTTDGESSLNVATLSENQNNQLTLEKLEQWQQFSPLDLDLSSDSQFLIMIEKGDNEMRLSRLELNTMEQTLLDTSNLNYWTVAWFNSNDQFFLGGKLSLSDLDMKRQSLYYSANTIIDIDYSASSNSLVVSEAVANFNLQKSTLFTDKLMPSDNQQEFDGQVGSVELVPSTKIDHIPAFSTSNERLAFISGRSQLNRLGIWLMDYPLGEPYFVKELPVNFVVAGLSWSSDDQFLLLTSNQNQVYLFNLSSRQLRRISPPGIQFYAAHWLDNNTIQYSIEQGDSWQVFSVDPRSTDVNNNNASQENAMAADLIYDSFSGILLKTLPENKAIVYHWSQNRSILLADLSSNQQSSLLVNIGFEEYYVTENGIYYLQDFGGKTSLNYYHFINKTSELVQDMGLTTANTGVPRRFAISEKLNQFIYSKPDNIEADLLLFKVTADSL